MAEMPRKQGDHILSLRRLAKLVAFCGTMTAGTLGMLLHGLLEEGRKLAIWALRLKLADLRHTPTPTRSSPVASRYNHKPPG